jgi:CheY-like chemotaxis protein
MEDQTKPLTGLRILVVEDEIMIAMMLEEMLQDFGCSVVTLAPNIEKAVAAIRQHVFDGVLLDINIHGQKTIAVAEELVSRAIPFLLVTGYSGGDSDPPVMKSAPRLQKPFDEAALAQRMEKVFVASAGNA